MSRSLQFAFEDDILLHTLVFTFVQQSLDRYAVFA